MSAINPFIDVHVPLNLWPTLLAEFGRDLNYWPGGDQSQSEPVSGIWKDGADDEDVSPGRYSRLYVSNADLTVAPAEDDMVESEEGQQFDVVRVVALPYYFSVLTLHEVGATP